MNSFPGFEINQRVLLYLATLAKEVDAVNRFRAEMINPSNLLNNSATEATWQLSK